MKRLILDTNIYGRIIERKERELVEKALTDKSDIVIYGFDVVRKELRNVSKNVRYGGVRVRLALLSLYDNIAKTHIYLTTSLVRTNENAMKTYKIVNKLRNYRTPDFINYDVFRRLIV